MVLRGTDLIVRHMHVSHIVDIPDYIHGDLFLPRAQIRRVVESNTTHDIHNSSYLNNFMIYEHHLRTIYKTFSTTLLKQHFLLLLIALFRTNAFNQHIICIEMF